jgi:hypothetical protein
LTYIFKKIFKKPNLFSLGCLVVYALANTILQWIIFRNNKFSMLGVMNILVVSSIFVGEKVFERYKNLIKTNYKGIKYSFQKKLYIFVIPSLIEFVFYLFGLIQF